MGCSEMTAMSVGQCRGCQIRVALGLGGPFTLGQLRSACGESDDTMMPSSWDFCRHFLKSLEYCSFRKASQQHFCDKKRSHHICQEQQPIIMHGRPDEWHDLAAEGTRRRRLEYKGERGGSSSQKVEHTYSKIEV